jgi:hypothetical protein
MNYADIVVFNYKVVDDVNCIIVRLFVFLSYVLGKKHKYWPKLQI